jgi:hypothetical protein
MQMATCHDSEGWKVVSRIRDFDSTLCFEEGIILSSVLGLLLVSALLRSLFLAQSELMVRSAKSLWVLRGKLVCAPLSRIGGVKLDFEIGLAHYSFRRKRC